MSTTKHTIQRRQDLPVVHPRAAGIDIGAQFHVVAVAADLDPQPVRTFRSFTHDLHRLAEWLAAVGITTVAMESTGVYWIPQDLRKSGSEGRRGIGKAVRLAA